MKTNKKDTKIDIIKGQTTSIYDAVEWLKGMAGFTLFLMLLVMVISLIFVTKFNSLENKIADLSIAVPDITTGTIEAIGYDSVTVNGAIYDGVCDADLDNLLIGDYVLVEKGGLFNCDSFRVTIQREREE